MLYKCPTNTSWMQCKTYTDANMFLVCDQCSEKSCSKINNDDTRSTSDRRKSLQDMGCRSTIDPYTKYSNIYHSDVNISDFNPDRAHIKKQILPHEHSKSTTNVQEYIIKQLDKSLKVSGCYICTLIHFFNKPVKDSHIDLLFNIMKRVYNILYSASNEKDLLYLAMMNQPQSNPQQPNHVVTIQEKKSYDAMNESERKQFRKYVLNNLEDPPVFTRKLLTLSSLKRDINELFGIDINRVKMDMITVTNLTSDEKVFVKKVLTCGHPWASECTHFKQFKPEYIDDTTPYWKHLRQKHYCLMYPDNKRCPSTLYNNICLEHHDFGCTEKYSYANKVKSTPYDTARYEKLIQNDSRNTVSDILAVKNISVDAWSVTSKTEPVPGTTVNNGDDHNDEPDSTSIPISAKKGR